jgi:hypothetical protein
VREKGKRYIGSNKKENTLDKLNQSVSEIYSNDPLKQQDAISGSKKKSTALEFLI